LEAYVIYIYSHIKDNINKQKMSVGQLEVEAIGDGRHLIPGTIAKGVDLPSAFQDGAHCLQYVIGRVWILEDPENGRHAMVHQNLGGIPHQNCQPPDLGDLLHLGFLEVPLELDDLHQPLTIVSGVEALGLRLHRHLLMQI
jgi:hypothetical protein